MVESSVSLEQFPDDPPAKSGCGSCGSGSAAEGLSQCGNGLEKIYPTTAVRFGFMRYIGEFSHPPEMKFTCGASVVIQSKRGIEIGQQVSLTCHGCDKSVNRDQMREWVDACGEDSYAFDAGRILREATAADLAEFAHIQTDNKTRRHFCQELAERHRLPLRVVECETLFGGERIIFFFTSEERVDFRGLVKELAQEYRTRIEMRQVGARDEARLLADFETCGREVCCKVFLKTLRPISMRMAKVQKATLDPTQVSGRCGRLKCCLRYEHEGYEELDKRLPRNGVRIRTEHGEGVVINRQILTQLVQVRKDDGTIMTVVVEDITDVNVPPPEERAPDEAKRQESGGSQDSQQRRGRDGKRPNRGRRQRPGQKSSEAPGRGTNSNSSEGSGPDGSRQDNEGTGEASGEEKGGARSQRGRRRRGRRRGRGGSGGPPREGTQE